MLSLTVEPRIAAVDVATDELVGVVHDITSCFASPNFCVCRTPSDFVDVAIMLQLYTCDMCVVLRCINYLNVPYTFRSCTLHIHQNDSRSIILFFQLYSSFMSHFTIT